MSNAALFFSGFLVTLAVVVGIGLLIWGAILDGRYNREVQELARAARSPNGHDTSVEDTRRAVRG
jgi:hypothetical protein